MNIKLLIESFNLFFDTTLRNESIKKDYEHCKESLNLYQDKIKETEVDYKNQRDKY